MAAPALVQQTTAKGLATGTSVTATLTLASAVAAGDFLVVDVAQNGATSVPGLPTFSQGVWTLVTSQGNGTRAARLMICQNAPAIAAGGTIVVTEANATSQALQIGVALMHWTGMSSASGVVDKTTVATGTGSGSLSLTPTVPGAIIFAGASLSGTSGTAAFTPPSGFTAGPAQTDMANGEAAALFYKVSSGLVVQGGTATWTPSIFGFVGMADCNPASVVASSSESGSGTDAGSAVRLGASESGSGSESTVLAAATLSAETGSGADAASSTKLSLTETGSGVDAAASVALSALDAVTGTDALGALLAALTAAEIGSGTDLAVPMANVFAADTGAGSEQILGSVTLSDADSAAMTDALASLLADVLGSEALAFLDAELVEPLRTRGCVHPTATAVTSVLPSASAVTTIVPTARPVTTVVPRVESC